MKKCIFLLGGIVFSVLVFGQDQAVKLKNSDRLSETSETPKVIAGNEKVSDYFQLEKRLLKLTVGNTIPASVPKHQAGQSKTEYRETILYWCKSNINLVNEEYKIKFTDEAQFQRALQKIRESK